jgi:hypothetical protein
MVETLLSLPTWAGICVAMLIATVTGLSVYFVSYSLISRNQTDNLKSGVGDLFRVLGRWSV